MRLADDERGRVPFALIGVLLLLGSVGVATIQLDNRRVNDNATLAGDRAEAAAETTLRDAVRDAGTRAAANPVVSRSNGTYGQVLDSERPYRSYLELLVAIELRERLDGTPQRVADASGTVALNPIEDPQSARVAVENVDVSRAGRGMVAVEVEDVPIEVRRNGERVATRHRTLSVNVSTPALTLHERTAAFQSRLNGGTLEPGTLNRGLTGALWSLAWARGYAQYANVPLENVLTNEHVELLTNRAALDVQRSVFGGADEQGREQLAHRSAEVVANELLGLGAIGLEAAGLPTGTGEPTAGGSVESPDPDRRTIGVNDTADRALADVVEATAEPDDALVSAGEDPWQYGYRETVRTAASIDARLLTTRRAGDVERTHTEAPPGGEWTRGRTIASAETEVLSIRTGSAPAPAAPSGWSTHRTVERTVVLTWTETVRYENEDNGTSRTFEERYQRPVDVGASIVHRPVQRDWIPRADVAGSDGDVYAPLLDDAEAELFGSRGGVRGVVADVATEDAIEAATTVAPDDVAALADDAYGEVAGVREAVREITTTAPPTHALSDEAPAEDLAASVRDRSDEYRGVPATYDGLRHRGAVALRGVYVDRVLRRLDARDDGGEAARSDISGKVGELSQLPGVGLSEFFEVGMDYARPESRPIETREPAPSLDLTVDADPSYLSTSEVQDTRVPPPDDPYHPMAARTTTIDSLPTDRITETLVEAITGIFGDEESKQAPLPVAARTLRSAERVNRSEARERDMVVARATLREAVTGGLDDLEGRAAETLAAATELSSAESATVVDEALSIYGGPGVTVIAMNDGSATARIADVAARRDDVDDVDADRARTLLRDDVHEFVAEDDNQVELSTVESVSEPTRDVVRQSVQRVVDEGDARAEEAVRRRILQETRFSVLPSRGFPVAPVPTWWVVTANVWHVEVHGSYSSFVVRAEQGGPSGGAHVSYVRDGQAVRVDVDGDGGPETLGTSDRIRFFATSTVAVAVPRGGGGVGNNGTGFQSETDGWDSDWRDSDGGRSNGCRRRPGDGEPRYEFCQEARDGQ